MLGTAFFLGISAMMQGSETDFIHRLIDNSPHITIQDEYRNPQLQPVAQLLSRRRRSRCTASSRKPKPAASAIIMQALDYLRAMPGLTASPMLQGTGLVSFAGKDEALSLNGMIPADINYGFHHRQTT